VKREGFMIGSGVVEAACKTLVAQRLKLSGMRWGMILPRFGGLIDYAA
jgi:hypothetical protein